MKKRRLGGLRLLVALGALVLILAGMWIYDSLRMKAAYTTVRKEVPIRAGDATAAPAPAAESQAVQEELGRLQGEWSVVSRLSNGKPESSQRLRVIRNTYQGQQVTTTAAGHAYYTEKITIDRSKKPSTIDYEMVGETNRSMRKLGIYELDGDTLKTCVGAPGAERPTDFSGAEGSGGRLTVWTRVKTTEHSQNSHASKK